MPFLRDVVSIFTILAQDAVGTEPNAHSSVAETRGGVAPVGHPEPLRTIVDVALAQYDVVWAAGGHPHYVFPTSYDELLRITGGEAAEVGA
ncbi:MAG: hypothetical protein B7C55_10180 [Actinomycetales bacterium mxb001]|nr:MAG: hypothetical protein B7C55_10180 [Actinomycetales bacterium mxb001]